MVPILPTRRAYKVAKNPVLRKGRMKTAIAAVLTITTMWLGTTTVRGQEADSPNYGGRILRRHQAQLQKEQSERIRIERAQQRKRQRIESQQEVVRQNRYGFDPFQTRTR